jgi:hypothetical protein
LTASGLGGGDRDLHGHGRRGKSSLPHGGLRDSGAAFAVGSAAAAAFHYRKLKFIGSDKEKIYRKYRIKFKKNLIFF